ncbi:4-hydroxy-3-methylbut-2-enyl diphosphate reductase [Spirochaetia bacterium]|nr:4-hydroxy-3-methylbut-2-enyl diphosphate reductase [Spirochaetia bacterium]
MKVIRACVLGYCMGVRRAMDMAEAALATGSQSPVYAMGSLIHNPQAMKSLINRGLTVLEESNLPGDLSGARVIIRAHGITPHLEAALTNRGATLIDATCPRVKASQIKAQSLCREGYRVFLAGEKEHGEIIGIRGYAPDCIIVGDPVSAAAAAEKLFLEEPRPVKTKRSIKTALIGQTTISPDEYTAIAQAIETVFPNLHSINTICRATRDRQDSLRELCGQVDAVIVAGGCESANTRRLLAIARAAGRGIPAWLVETPAEIPGEIRSFTTVGLCAGASTPDGLIDVIEEALMKIDCKRITPEVVL